VTMSIATTAPTSAAFHTTAAPFYASIFPLFGIVLVTRKRRRGKRWGFSGTCILALLLLIGCGGGSSGTGPQPMPGTPPGTYTVAVQAISGTVSHSTTVTLTVQ
jgi:hypothetical protein